MSVEYRVSYKGIGNLVTKLFSRMSKRNKDMFTEIGERISDLLYLKYLRGGAIFLTKKVSSTGKPTFGYRVFDNRRGVVVRAFPLNLFEYGRSGYKDLPKRRGVMTKKLPRDAKSIVESVTKKYNLGSLKF